MDKIVEAQLSFYNDMDGPRNKIKNFKSGFVAECIIDENIFSLAHIKFLNKNIVFPGEKNIKAEVTFLNWENIREYVVFESKFFFGQSSLYFGEGVVKKIVVNNYFIQMVKNLASPPEEQKKYLESICTYPCLDELALEYDDFFVLLKYQDKKEVNEATYVKMLKIDTLLNNLSGSHNEKFWYGIEALTLPEWNEIRNLAKEVLKEIS